MRRFFVSLCVLALLLCCVTLSVTAADGNVTYSGDAGEFLFAPGSDYSPTDLFPNFKDVMPGDSLSQHITVKNDASNQVKVKIYVRCLGAHADSVAFLSQLRLRVEKSEENTMAYMFDAVAGETAQLTDWICLGTLYSGGEVNLNVILDVPVELDNRFQQSIGYLDWEFMIEEYEIEQTDPTPPQTGDNAKVFMWAGWMFTSMCGLIILLLTWKRREKEQC